MRLLIAASIAGLLALHPGAVAQELDGLIEYQLDDLKPDSVFGESPDLPTLGTSFDFLTEEEEEFLRGLTFSVMPLINYFDQRSGDLQGRTGGGAQLDLSFPLGPRRNLVVHGGANATLDSMSGNPAVSIDFSKLADLRSFSDGTQTIYDRLVIGFGFDMFTIDDAPLGDRELFMAQVKFAVGAALSQFMDIGVAFAWPLNDTSRAARSTSQFKFYWAGTLTDTVEMVAFLGTHNFPDTTFGGIELAAFPSVNRAVHVGIAVDDANDNNTTFYIGIQQLFGADWSQDTLQRGYHHRLGRGGMFRTVMPGDGEFFREF